MCLRVHACVRVFGYCVLRTRSVTLRPSILRLALAHSCIRIIDDAGASVVTYECVTQIFWNKSEDRLWYFLKIFNYSTIC